MHLSLVIALVGGLAIAVVSFVVFGFRRWRRTAGLASRAHALGLRFSPDDPFDITHRYRQLPIISSGHSPLAENVSYGRVDGWPIRALQFHYENGHGTRRLTRHISLLIFELDFPLSTACMWNNRDLSDSPLEARNASGRLEHWIYNGDAEFCRTISRLADDLGKKGFNIHTLGQSIFFSVSEKHGGNNYTEYIKPVIAVLEELSRSGKQTSAANS